MPASKGSRKSSSTRSSASRTKGRKSKTKGSAGRRRASTGLVGRMTKAVTETVSTVASGAVAGAAEGFKQAGQKVTGPGRTSSSRQGKGRSKARWRKGSEE